MSNHHSPPESPLCPHCSHPLTFHTLGPRRACTQSGCRCQGVRQKNAPGEGKCDITARIPITIRVRLDRLAKKLDRSRNWLVGRCLELGVGRLEGEEKRGRRVAGAVEGEVHKGQEV
jgi:predicted transcriptional regulator